MNNRRDSGRERPARPRWGKDRLSFRGSWDRAAGPSMSAPARTTGDHRNIRAWIRRGPAVAVRSEEHTSELQSQFHLVCRLLLEKKNLDVYDVYSVGRVVVY